MRSSIITNRKELARLLDRTMRNLPKAEDSRPEQEKGLRAGENHPDTMKVESQAGPGLSLPAPRGGVAYSQEEVAELCAVRVSTVRDWVSRGLRCDGDVVRLQTLRAPRGQVTPEALRAFLEQVNGIRVQIERMTSSSSA